MATIRDRYPKLSEILDEPKKKRMLLLLLFTVLAFIAIMIYNTLSDSRAAAPQETGTAGSVLPEIAEGSSRDDLANTSMMSQHEATTRRRSAEDIYNNAMPEDMLNLNADEVRRESQQREEQRAAAGTPAEQGLSFFGVTPDTEETVSPTPPVRQSSSRGTASSSSARSSSGGTATTPRTYKSTDERLADADAYLVSQGIDPRTGLPLPKEEAPAAEEEKTSGETATQAESAPVQVRRTGGISSLDDGFSGTLDNLDSESEYITEDASHPYRVTFIRDQKISDGDRVTVRLLEDLPIGGMLIPQNTHLQATAKIGERLELKVSSFEMNGKLHSLSYSAYDNDGGRGLYCPQTSANKTVKEGTSQAGNIVTQTLTSGITGVAGRVVQAGSQIARSSSGKVTVTLVSGYEFFLMQEKN